MNSDKAEIKDSREDLPIFIHSALDDYGLSAIEFRVYARLARRCGRGSAFESVPNMAKDFEVSDRTIQRSLKVLSKVNLISETIRPGKPTLYTLNPQKVWHPPKRLKGIREEVFNKRVTGDTTDGGDMRDGGGVTPQRGVVVTPQTDEGTPVEVTPTKVEESDPLQHPAVLAYNEALKPQPALSIHQCETIAANITDLALWGEVLMIFKGNGHRPRYAGNVVDRYKNELTRRAARGSPPTPPPKVATFDRINACQLCDHDGWRETFEGKKRIRFKCTHERLTDEQPEHSARCNA